MPILPNFDPSKYKNPLPESTASRPDSLTSAVGPLVDQVDPYITGTFNGLENVRNGVLQAGSQIGATAGLWSQDSANRANDRLEKNRTFEERYPKGSPQRAAFDMSTILAEASPYAAPGMGAAKATSSLGLAAKSLLKGTTLGFLQHADSEGQRIQNTLLGGTLGLAGTMATGLNHLTRTIGNLFINGPAGALQSATAKVIPSAIGNAVMGMGMGMAASSGDIVNQFKPENYVDPAAPKKVDAIGNPIVAAPPTVPAEPTGYADILQRNGVTADQVNTRMAQMLEDPNRGLSGGTFADGGMDVMAVDGMLRRQSESDQRRLLSSIPGGPSDNALGFSIPAGTPYLTSIEPVR